MAGAYETLLIAREGAVAEVTLNRPDRLNALSHTLVQELTVCLGGLGADDGVRAILISGAGRGFCAGADLSEGGMRDAEGDVGARIAADMERLHNRLVRALSGLDKPVIAAVNGPAAGGGMSLALACDIVLAAESAYFVQVFGPQLGLVPDMGSSWFLPRLAGRARALGLALTGERIPAAKAAEWGLIWACLPDDRLAAESRALVGRLAAGPTVGFGLIKRALRAADSNDLDTQLDLERELQGRAASTADFLEGVAAFNEKRKPRFRGT